MNQPLVSVVTPFHNTAKYLSQCIDSVLSQSYSNFEYILVDNCSTDGAGEIAASYAQRDPRIRLVRRMSLLPQVQNYNAALAEISPQSKYCKIVQADDYIFPDCLRLMAEAFERSESIGLVSAYDLKGNVVRGSGFPYRKSPIAGREVGQHYFRVGTFIFGSPTTVMYRSSLVRERQPFYDESYLHEDTEKCLQILKNWDFGFVYQVLSFLRVEEGSITGTVRDLSPDALDRYILVQRYAKSFLDEPEADVIAKQEKKDYYEVLAQAVLHFRDKKFWQYHQAGLSTIGETIDGFLVSLYAAQAILEMIVNPGITMRRALRLFRRKSQPSRVPQPDPRLHASSPR